MELRLWNVVNHVSSCVIQGGSHPNFGFGTLKSGILSWKSWYFWWFSATHPNIVSPQRFAFSPAQRCVYYLKIKCIVYHGDNINPPPSVKPWFKTFGQILKIWKPFFKHLEEKFWKYENPEKMRAKKIGAFLGVLQGKTAKKRLFLKVPNRQKVDFWPARILEIWKPFFKHLGRILKIWKPFFKHLADFELKGGGFKANTLVVETCILSWIIQ